MVLLEEPRFTVVGHCVENSIAAFSAVCFEVSSIRADSVSMQRSGTFFHMTAMSSGEVFRQPPSGAMAFAHDTRPLRPSMEAPL